MSGGSSDGSEKARRKAGLFNLCKFAERLYPRLARVKGGKISLRPVALARIVAEQAILGSEPHPSQGIAQGS